MMEMTDSNGEQAAGPSPLTGREWRLLLVLGSVQFTHILDFMIVMPLGPQYLDKTKMALTPSQFGFMVSAYAFSACITGLLAAWFIDRFDRKTAMLVLYAGFAIGTLCCRRRPQLPLPGGGADRDRRLWRCRQRDGVDDCRRSVSG